MNQDTIQKIKSGGVGVLPTDTIYGIVGQALSQDVVERIYKLRQRQPYKPMIVLISSLEDLALFNIQADQKVKKFLQKIWPNPVSVVLPCPEEKFAYLHRGTKTLALRMPDKPDLLELLKQTGPLVAPSANPENLPPAETIEDAKNYFGDQVDFYEDGGKISASPSTLISIADNRIQVLRQGTFQLPEEVLE